MRQLFLQISLISMFAFGVVGCGSDGGLCQGQDCQCPANESCAFDCVGTPGCDQQCQGDCDVTCAAGQCDQQCSEGADCTVSCTGGDCDQQCSPGATCDFQCEGGGCDQSCLNNPNCTLSCSGGGCQTDQF